jgi:hypothetical protein
MTEHRFEFRWDVSRTGYRWVDATWTTAEGEEQAGPALVAADSPEFAATAGPRFSPDPDSMLFRVLAETRPDQEGIVALANRYGNLWSGLKLSLSLGGGGEHPAAPRGVPLWSWQVHIGAMRRLTGLWDLVQAGDEQALARNIRWLKESPEGPAVQFVRHMDPVAETAPSLDDDPACVVIASASSSPELLDSFRPGDLVRPARAYLGARLDALLFGAAQDVTFGMIWDARREHPVFSYHCPTLMAAVWMQFATVVGENLAYGRCRVCGTWFEIAPKAARTSRQFCSTSCRSKAYRDRQDSARRMYTAGKTFEAIAEVLESDVATVRKWITGIKDSNSGH